MTVSPARIGVGVSSDLATLIWSKVPSGHTTPSQSHVITNCCESGPALRSTTSRAVYSRDCCSLRWLGLFDLVKFQKRESLGRFPALPCDDDAMKGRLPSLPGELLGGHAFEVALTEPLPHLPFDDLSGSIGFELKSTTQGNDAE